MLCGNFTWMLNPSHGEPIFTTIKSNSRIRGNVNVVNCVHVVYFVHFVYLVHVVYFVHIVYFVHVVCFVHVVFVLKLTLTMEWRKCRILFRMEEFSFLPSFFFFFSFLFMRIFFTEKKCAFFLIFSSFCSGKCW